MSVREPTALVPTAPEYGTGMWAGAASTVVCSLARTRRPARRDLVTRMMAGVGGLRFCLVLEFVFVFVGFWRSMGDMVRD